MLHRMVFIIRKEIQSKKFSRRKKPGPSSPLIEVKLTKNAYEEYIRLTYPDLLKEMEDLGKSFYGDKYIKTYYYNSKDCTVGYVVITQEGTKRKESLENLSLSAWTRSAFPQLFEVK